MMIYLHLGFHKWSVPSIAVPPGPQARHLGELPELQKGAHCPLTRTGQSS